MKMSEYMQNPLGKGASALMLSSTRKALDDEYSNIVQKITHTWYSLQNKYYIAHIKIPSKSTSNIVYDVVIEIDIDSIPKQATTINDGNCRVFSNCPSFVFTYAYVFNKNKDIIPWTKKKYNNKVLNSNPGTRNPTELRNYEKSLYFAIKYITSNGRNYKNGVNLNVTTLRSHYQILNNLQSSDDVLNATRYEKSAEKTSSRNIDSNKKLTKKKINIPKKKEEPKNRTSKTTKTAKMKKISKTSKMKKI